MSSKSPPIYLLCLFALLLIIPSLALPIREIKPIPNPLTLAPDETVRLYTEDYFVGFNLTFSSSTSGPKLRHLTDTSLSSSSAKLISAKTDLVYTGSLLAFLYDDNSVVVSEYTKTSTFTQPIKISLNSVSKCFDFDFLGQDIIAVDCNSAQNNDPTLYFISVSQQRVIKTTPTKAPYIGHSARKLTNARHYNYTHLISFIPSSSSYDSKNYQINFIQLRPDLEVIGVSQIQKADQLLPSTFLLYDVKAFTSDSIALGGTNFILWLHNDNNKFEIKKYPISTPAYSFNTLYDTQFLTSALITSGTSAIEVLQGQDHGFLDTHSLFIDTIYSVTDRRTEKPAIVKFSQITKDFSVVITGGVNPSIYVYRRGDPKDSEVFYFNYISKETFQLDEPVQILTQPEDNIIFWVTKTKIYAILLQEVWIEITNNKPDGVVHNAFLKVCSLATCLDKNITLNFLNRDDFSIHKANIAELKLIKPWNKTLDIQLDDFFVGPHLDYYFITDNNESIPTAFHPIKLSLENLQFSFLGIHYDDVHDNFHLYHQTPSSKALDLYICKLPHADPGVLNAKLNCEKKNSTGNVGKVKKVHSRHPVFDIIEAVDDHGQREAYMTSKNIFSSAIKVHADAQACDVFHQSYDNIAEGNLFCGHENNISVVTNSSWTNIDHIILSKGFRIRKILTHPAYPGLIFISNNTNILIVNSEFYLGEHYSYDIATVATLNIQDPEFNFVVTSSHLLVFLPHNHSISEFDISNPKEIIFNKQYMLFGFHLLIQENTLTYSLNTDLVYFLGAYSYEAAHFVVVLEPNSYGNGNMRFVHRIGNAVEASSYAISVTPYTDGHDFLLYGSQNAVQALIVAKQHVISVEGNFIADTKLFAEKKFKLVARSPHREEEDSIKGTLTLVNTHRMVHSLINDDDLKLTLSYGNMQLASVAFHSQEFFEGPVYRFSLTKPYKNDNINLRERVNVPANPLKDTLPDAVADIGFKSGEAATGVILVVEERKNFVSVYNGSAFPLNDYQKDRFNISGLGGNSKDLFCYQVEVGDKEIYAGTLCYDYEASTAFIDITRLDNYNLKTYITAPDEDIHAVYKVISNYLVYVSKEGYFTVYIYKIIEDGKELKTKLIKVLNRDDLNIRKGDSVTSVDGREIGTNQIGILLATGATGLNYVLVKDETVKVKYEPTFTSSFASEHMDAYNNVPIFNALSIIDFKIGSVFNKWTIVLSSENAFAYRIELQIDAPANLFSPRVIEGYIQYQGYKWKEVVGVSKDIVVLVGETEHDINSALTAPLYHYFFYDRTTPKHTPGGKYPLFDAFQVMSQNSEYQMPIIMFTKRGEQEIVYLRDPIAQGTATASGIKECNVDKIFSIETYASRVTSGYIDLVAGNDAWNATIRVQIRSHGSLFQDVSPVKIILWVFGALGLIFILGAIVLRVFSNKEKKLLKDNFVRFKDEGNAETDPSQYFKIGE